MKWHHKNGGEEVNDTETYSRSQKTKTFLPEIDDKYIESAPELFISEKRRNSKPIAEATKNDVEDSDDDTEPTETLEIVL